jgi:hypothetical protein
MSLKSKDLADSEMARVMKKKGAKIEAKIP